MEEPVEQSPAADQAPQLASLSDSGLGTSVASSVRGDASSRSSVKFDGGRSLRNFISRKLALVKSGKGQ
jgi:hypothetical protein